MNGGLRDLLLLGDLDGLVREVDRRAGRADWDGILELRDACLEATEATGRQLWGPARYAAYRVALEGPAALAGAMLEPGVVRFGLGPLTEVVAQHHTFAELAPHVDAALLPVVAQERVLRGEDLRGDDRAVGSPDDPPLVLQAFEPAYVLPTYGPTERLDGAVAETTGGWAADWAPLGRAAPGGVAPGAAAPGGGAPGGTGRLVRALEDVVAPWATESGGDVRVVAVAGDVDDAVRALMGMADDRVRRRHLPVPMLFALLAHAGASGGVHGRRRGGAAGRSLAWWVARCATGLDHASDVDPDDLEFRLEDLDRIAFRTPGEAAWRLEVAVGGPAPHETGRHSSSGHPDAEWAVAIAAFDRSEEPPEVSAGADGETPWGWQDERG